MTATTTSDSLHRDVGGTVFTARVKARLIAPGSIQRCLHCHETLDFVPGGSRRQVARMLYDNGRLHHIELFHPDCYLDFCRQG